MKKTVLITGAAGGIGSVVAETLSKNEFDVIGIDKNQTALALLSSKLKISSICCDFTKLDELQSTCKELQELNIYGIVHCAGFGGPFCNIEETTNKHWADVQNCNVTSLFQILRSTLPNMKKNKQGRIVAISSIQGKLGSAGSAAYVSSKHALEGLIKTVTDEAGSHGIAANLIAPGYIESPMGANDEKKQDYQSKVLARTPTKSVGQPQEVAHLVLQLLQFPSSYLNGTSITIDGGISSTVGI